MNAKISATVFLSFLCGPAIAANYYVGASATGNKSGSDINNLMSLSSVNANLQPGDTAYLLDSQGDYTTTIEPARSGTAENKRISYVAYSGHKPTINFGVKLSGWTKVSGVDGVDAIYRTQYGTSVTKPILLTIGLLKEKGEKAMLWNVGNVNGTSGMLNRERNACYDTSCMVPGDHVYKDGYTYVRTYENDNPANHTIYSIKLNTQGIKLIDKDYITIKGITVKYVAKFADVMQGSDHVTFEDNTFNFAFGYGAIDIRESDYFIFRNNIIRGAGSIPAHTAEAISFINADYALIENNDISYFGHNGISMATTRYCIIRNNYIHHGFGKNALIKGWDSLTNVFEHNRSDDSPNADAVKDKHYADHAGIAIGGKHSIVRFNRYLNNSVAMDFTTIINDPTYTSPHHRVYHNVAYGSVPTRNHVHGGIMFYLDQQRDVKIVNNILAENVSGSEKSSGVDVEPSVPSQLGFANAAFIAKINPEIEYNILWSSVNTDKLFDKQSINSFQSAYPNNAKKNIGQNPMLMSTSKTYPDFKLRSGSPAIDAGRFLTTTIGNYSGNTVTVKDARFFIDGFGITTGDKIKVGNNSLVTITNINYGTNVITHNGNISGNAGEGVSFNYTGSAPDIGLYEYGQSDSGTEVAISPPSPPTSLLMQIFQ